ncbi:MAG TPA: ABC transporter permease [Ktedonobacteraceae bacterium]|nr:ABC transporter permease [Ktedonobacteraceae bacterium]
MSLQQQSTTDAAAMAEQRAKAAGRRYRRQQSAFDILVIFVILQLISVIYGLIRPNVFAYNSLANIQTALETIPIEVGIPALGVGVLMIAGEFDLSVGANFIISSIVMGQLATNGLNVWLSALIALVIGTGIGLINGLITLRLKIPSFITTLGTSFILIALTFFVHGESSQAFSATPVFGALTAGNLPGSLSVFSSEFLWWVVLAIAFWALLEQSKIGNHIYAVGGNKQAATATGVRVDRTKLLAFGLAGATAAFAGILAASRIGNIAPSGGQALPLEAIAACVIGGMALNGGRGTILGIILGSALIYWISDVLLLLGAPGIYIQAPIGLLIIGAAATYEILRARRT